MNTSDIKKALWCCSNGRCTVCPLNEVSCSEEMLMDFALEHIKLLEDKVDKQKRTLNSVYGTKPPTVDSINILTVNELKKNTLLELIERFKDTYKYCSLAHKPDFEQILSTLYSIVYQMVGDNK